MGDVYKEILIKKEGSAADTAKKAGLILVVILLAAAGIFLNPILIPVALVMAFVSGYLIQNLDLEYEYLYVNGDIDVDKIMNKTRRKQAGSFELVNLEVIALKTSHALDSYKNRSGVKYFDFTSGAADQKVFSAVYNKDGGLQIVDLELDEEVLQDLRKKAPRKVDINF